MNIKNKASLVRLFKLSSQDDNDCDCEIIHNTDTSYDDFNYYEDEENIPEFPNIYSLFEGSGIRMMYKDEPYSACVTENGNVVGALVAHQDGYWEWGEEMISVYYFSRVVSPSCHRKGIAKKLLYDFMSSHRDCIIKSETYNRVLDGSLIDAGFKEEWEETYGDRSVKLHTFVPELMREDYFKKESKYKSQDIIRFSRLNKLNSISRYL
jgi:hypothetical protein